MVRDCMCEWAETSNNTQPRSPGLSLHDAVLRNLASIDCVGDVTNGHCLITNMASAVRSGLPRPGWSVLYKMDAARAIEQPMRVWTPSSRIHFAVPLSRILPYHEHGCSVTDKACVGLLGLLAMGFSKKCRLQNPKGKKSPQDTLPNTLPIGATGNGLTIMGSIFDTCGLPKVHLQRFI